MIGVKTTKNKAFPIEIKLNSGKQYLTLNASVQLERKLSQVNKDLFKQVH